MRGVQVVNDGLWRCLCPSWELIVISRAVRRPVPHPTQSRTRLRPGAQIRSFGVESLEDASKYIQRAELEGQKLKRKALRPKPADGVAEPEAVDRLLLAPTPPTRQTLDSLEFDILIQSLKKLRDPAGYAIAGGQQCNRYERIFLFVENLVSRGYPRDLFIYECVVDAMADPQGSSQSLRRILQEMETEGIEISPTICQGALAALAVHPNYALRHQVLSTMQEFWHQTEKGSTNDILIAMLREGQHELAYNKLMKALEKGDLFPLWLYDIFVLEFGNQGFLDEMISLFMRRKHAKGSDKGAVSLIYCCLDLCSRALHYEGTSYAWNSCVRQDGISPSDGILENVLATAARAGDANLAAEVHEIISERRRIQIHHYDALTEAFLNGDDVKGAVRMLCIMEENGLKVLPENTRALFKVLSKDLDALQKAHTALLDHTRDKYAPTGVFSVILEAAAKSGRHTLAQSLYQDVEGLTGQGPSARIVEDMILNSDDAENTRAYIDDYKRLVPQDYLTVGRLEAAYDRLVITCMGISEWDLAIRFARASFLEHGKSNKDSAPVWLEALAKLCIAKEHSGIWKLLDEYARGGNRLAVSNIVKEARLAKRRYQKGLESDADVMLGAGLADNARGADAMLKGPTAREKEAEAMREASIPDDNVFEKMDRPRRSYG